jgi:hypothetical protein
VLSVILVFGIIYFGYHIVNGLFTRSNLSIENTSITVEKISEIKELIAAEYYGEVVHSLKDQYLDDLIKWINTLYGKIKEAEKNGNEYPTKKINEEKVEKKELVGNLEEIIKKEEEKKLSYIINSLTKYSDWDNRLKKFVMIIDKKDKKLKELQDELKKLLLKKDQEHFKKEHKRIFEEALEKMKTDIAYLVRGSVKAVYDLKINDKTHFFCECTGTLVLNLKLELVGKINPWFIFGEKVKVEGYTILKEENLKLEKPESYIHILNLKEGCRQKLVEEAKKAGIETKAKESAEKSLGNFLSLFRYKDKEIKSVKIMESLDEFKKEKSRCFYFDCPRLAFRHILAFLDYFKELVDKIN